MSLTTKAIIAVAAGAILGGLVTYFLLKKFDKQETDVLEVDEDDIDLGEELEEEEEDTEQATGFSIEDAEAINNSALAEYRKRIGQTLTDICVKIIDEDEMDDDPSYFHNDLNYYKNGVLTDDEDNPFTDDELVSILGSIMGTELYCRSSEPGSHVYLRNDTRRSYYDIYISACDYVPEDDGEWIDET